MLDDAEITDLVRAGESDCLELTESADLSKIRHAICAFANDLPGHKKPGIVIVGLRDDGTCAELTIDDDLLVLLGGLRADGKILPFPVMSVGRRSIEGCDVAVVQVEPSDTLPHRVDGRCWIRVGPRRAQATAAEERRLVEKQVAGTQEFDSRPLSGARLDDLDLHYFELAYLPLAVSPEVRVENDRTLQEQLRSLRLLDRNERPTAAALLALGHDPRTFLPGAYIQFLRVDGEDLADPVRSQREISGRLVEQLQAITAVLDVNIEAPMSIDAGPPHRIRPNYPILALRQIVYNAVMHRTYETSTPVRVTWYRDRIEVISPGGAYGEVNSHNFGQPGSVSYRNPLVAEIMKNAGYAERFGAGIAIARRALAHNGNPPPEFSAEENYVWAIVRPQQ
ncbi:MAG: transcriptional regulator [bacterium]|nr:transcriptional regulator [bacterium]